ncbi:hypothetical protein OIU77_022537 [Salix suchowensis]|uniref:Uncharacterized protein n=1 Tax=Salix suchowensis TaxID=1278906 RepID=A0ABQ9C2M9_9ROSI|nr:hypothetical protein OIU77_022537 [Salix suchowensis]KAJ6393076.1 hypothetical protein OIU77_022537 [Salix suchowensis]
MEPRASCYLEVCIFLRKGQQLIIIFMGSGLTNCRQTCSSLLGIRGESGEGKNTWGRGCMHHGSVFVSIGF